MGDDEFISHARHFQAPAEIIPLIDQDLDSSGNDHRQGTEDLSIGGEDLLDLTLRVDTGDPSMMDPYLKTLHILQETADNILSLHLPGRAGEDASPPACQPAEIGVLNQEGAARDGLISLDPSGPDGRIETCWPSSHHDYIIVISHPSPSGDRG